MKRNSHLINRLLEGNIQFFGAVSGCGRDLDVYIEIREAMYHLLKGLTGPAVAGSHRRNHMKHFHDDSITCIASAVATGSADDVKAVRLSRPRSLVMATTSPKVKNV